MYQYKGLLKSSREIVAEGHTVEDIEHEVLHFRREQKKAIHTKGNEPVEVVHVFRDGEKEKLIKII